MQTKLMTLLVLCIASDACAQCGTVQLTTPPNFVADNGGSVGGMAYFTLDSQAQNGVMICGINVNTTTVGEIHGLVYRHQSITDVNLLTAANNTAADWCVVGCLRGTANPEGTPSPMSVVSGSHSIDLPQGQYLLAIGNGNFSHRYTNGGATNLAIGDGNLRFIAGQAANELYSTNLFAPRVFDATFDYSVATAPIALSPCGPNCLEGSLTSIGTGCGGTAATVYEMFDLLNPFDLGNNDLAYSANAGTITVNSSPATAIVPPIAADLGLGDDESSPLIPLGFSLDAFGLCADAISVQSNGCIWLGTQGRGDYSPSVAEFESEEARIAACWTDLRPLAGGGLGTIHADISSNSVRITYNGVAEWGTTNLVTFQVEITPTAILVRYSPTTLFPEEELVGFHNGIAQVSAPGSNLNGGAVAVSGREALVLSAAERPVLAGVLRLTLTGTPSIGIVLCRLGLATLPGTQPQSPPWSAGCEIYIQGGVILGLTASCTDTFPLNMPSTNNLIGLPLGCQGFAVSTTASTLLASNGLNAILGNY